MPRASHRPLLLPPRSVLLAFSLLLLLANVPVRGQQQATPASSAAPTPHWPQWGGPERDFHVRDVELLPWTEETQPEELWQRPLGEGYSSIIVVGDLLYTLYRESDDEIVVAIATADGETRWTHRYPAPPTAEMRLGFGEGPHATPLWIKGQLFTVGTMGTFHALDAATGEVLWMKELWGDPAKGGLGGDLLVRGYGASPVPYGDTVILPVGGTKRGLVAFAREDGREMWHSPGFAGSPASPILIDVSGHEQLVDFVNDEVVAVDPATGEELWRHPHSSGASYNISMPVYHPGLSLLFVSSAYGGGSRALRLGYDGDRPTVEEAWGNDRIKVHFTNAVRVEDYLYAATGRSGALMLFALDFATGELAWRERAVGRSSLLVVGERALALQEDGTLFLLKLQPDYLSKAGEIEIVDGQTWTLPTLVGDRLYLRDTKTLRALRLPVAGE